MTKQEIRHRVDEIVKNAFCSDEDGELDESHVERLLLDCLIFPLDALLDALRPCDINRRERGRKSAV